MFFLDLLSHRRPQRPQTKPDQKKHGLEAEKNDWDMEHIATIHNHLRFLGGSSKVKVVTSDMGFIKVLEAEGYEIIDPEKESLDDVMSRLSKSE